MNRRSRRTPAGTYFYARVAKESVKMETTWDLGVFYQNFNDPALRADIQAIPALVAQGHALLDAPLSDVERLERLVSQLEALQNKLSRTML